MKEVNQSLQQEKENYKAVFFQKRTVCNRQKRVHKWRNTETYHADCWRDYRQANKYRQFYR